MRLKNYDIDKRNKVENFTEVEIFFCINPPVDGQDVDICQVQFFLFRTWLI